MRSRYKLLGFSILFLFILSTFVFAAGTPPINSSAELYWGLDNTTINFNDYTPNNNDGTNGGTTFTSSGKISGTYEWDGSDYIQINTLGLSGDRSHCMWIYLDSYAPTLGRMTADYRSEYNIWDFVQETGDTDQHKLAVTVSDGATKRIHSNETIPLSTWTHYCSVIDENNALTLYINGEFQNSVSIGTVTTASQPTSNLGGYYGRDAFFWDGKIDEFVVFNTAITEENVKYLYAEDNPSSYEQYPFEVKPEPEPTDTDIFELATGFSRDDTQSITSTSYQTFMNGNFNLDFPSAVAFNIIFNLESGVNDDFSCRAIIDDTYESEINITTQTANEITSNYLITTAPTLSTGIHNFEFQCKKIGGTDGEVSLLSGILEQSTDDTGTDINFARVTNSSTIDSGNLTTILQTNYTVQGYNQTQNPTTLILDGYAHIDFKGTERQVELQYFIDDVFVESTLRDGSTTGSLAVYTGLNATEGDTIDLKVKARINSGTLSDLDITSSVVIKEFVFLDYENQFDSSILSPVNVTTSETEIYNYNFIGDPTSNYIVKFVGNGVGDTNNQDLDCTIKFNDDVLSSFTAMRTMKTLGKYKVVNNQYILENATTGTNNVSVSCIVDTGTVEIDPAVLFHAADKGSLNYTSMNFYAYDFSSTDTINTFNVSISNNVYSDIEFTDFTEFTNNIIDLNFTTFHSYTGLSGTEQIRFFYDSEDVLFISTNLGNETYELDDPCKANGELNGIIRLDISSDVNDNLIVFCNAPSSVAMNISGTGITQINEIQLMNVENTLIQTTDGEATYFYADNVKYINATYLAEDYLSEQINDYLVNGDINQSMIFQKFNVTAYDSVTLSTINDFSIDYHGTTYTTSMGYIELIGLEQVEQFNIYADEYRKETIVHDITTDLNESLNSSIATLTFFDVDDASNIENATIKIYDGTKTLLYYTLETNSSGEIEFNTKVSGVDKDTFIISFEPLQGYISPLDFNRTFNIFPYSETFNIERTNIHINIYDRADFEYVTELVDVQLLNVLNVNTTNGTIDIKNVNIATGEQFLFVTSANYNSEVLKFDYVSQSDVTINIYLLNSTQTGLGSLFVNVVDQDESPVEDATCELFEYNEDSLQYIKISETFSNSNGECFFNYEVGTKLYFVQGSKIFNDVLSEAVTTPEKFNTDSEVRELLLQETSRFDPAFYDKIFIDVDESFDDVTNTSSIDVTYSTIDNLVAEVCVKYYNFTLVTKTFITEFCTQSSDAVTSIEAQLGLDSNLNYLAQVTFDVSGDEIVYREFRYYGENSIEGILSEEYLANIFILLIWCGLLAFAVDSKNISMFVYLGYFLSVITTFFFPNLLISTGNVLIIIILSFILHISRRKQDVQ